MKTYDDQLEAMDELDRLLSEGKPVGMQAAVQYLPYFFGDWKLPFNGHMTIAYGREGDEYLIGDPYYEHVTRIKRDDLRKARFANGPAAPRGFIYYPLQFPEKIDYKKAIKKAVKHTVFMMLQPMFPYYGILGIKTLARRIRKLQNHPDKKFIKSLLGHFIIFQEEVGTGGGGFRYIYAAFLREAYDLLKIPELLEASNKMVEVGDKWRLAASTCGKFIQGKTDTVDLNKTAQLYRECAQDEKEVYLLLKRIKWK